MGEDNIAIKDYTMYFNGYPLGYVGELALVEEPEDTYCNFDGTKYLTRYNSNTITFNVEFTEEGKASLLNVLFPNWRKKDFWALYSNYKKKKRIKH